MESRGVAVFNESGKGNRVAGLSSPRKRYCDQAPLTEITRDDVRAPSD